MTSKFTPISFAEATDSELQEAFYFVGGDESAPEILDQVTLSEGDRWVITRSLEAEGYGMIQVDLNNRIPPYSKNFAIEYGNGMPVRCPNSTVVVDLEGGRFEDSTFTFTKKGDTFTVKWSKYPTDKLVIRRVKTEKVRLSDGEWAHNAEGKWSATYYEGKVNHGVVHVDDTPRAAFINGYDIMW